MTLDKPFLHIYPLWHFLLALRCKGTVSGTAKDLEPLGEVWTLYAFQPSPCSPCSRKYLNRHRQLLNMLNFAGVPHQGPLKHRPSTTEITAVYYLRISPIAMVTATGESTAVLFLLSQPSTALSRRRLCSRDNYCLALVRKVQQKS